MNINQLKYFVAVAEHQNFTKAATQHYISQTAIKSFLWKPGPSWNG